MSRGLGRVEQAAIHYLTADPYWHNPETITVTELATEVFGPTPTHGQTESARRALHSLVRKGQLQAVEDDDAEAWDQVAYRRR